VTGDPLDPQCAHGVWLVSRPGRSNWCGECERAGFTVMPHEHDASCAFGNPQCPLFGQPPARRTPWWRRLLRVGGL
jgi:hypothetical protein